MHGLAGGGRAELWPHLLPGLGTLAQCANCTALQGNPIWCQHCVWFRISTQLKSLKDRWMKGKISWAATTTHYCQLLLPSRQESVRAWSKSWPWGRREWTVSFLVLPGYICEQKGALFIITLDNRHKSRLPWTTGTYGNPK